MASTIQILFNKYHICDTSCTKRRSARLVPTIYKGIVSLLYPCGLEVCVDTYQPWVIMRLRVEDEISAAIIAEKMIHAWVDHMSSVHGSREDRVRETISRKRKRSYEEEDQC